MDSVLLTREVCITTQRRSGMLAAQLAVWLLLNQLSNVACQCSEQEYDQVNYIPVSPDQASTQFYQWRGGVEATTGIIYGIPFQATSVLRIDPETDTADVVAAEGQVGICPYSSPQGCWDGGVLFSDIIYGIPSCARKVFRFDPKTESVVYFGENNAIFSGGCQDSGNWRGGVAMGGVIFGIPLSSDKVLRIHPIAQTIDSVTLSSSSGNMGWSGGVLIPQQSCPHAEREGCIVGAPYNATAPLLISSSGSQATTTATVLSGSWPTEVGTNGTVGKYQGAVYAQGTIFFIPWETTQVLTYTKSVGEANGIHDQFSISGTPAKKDWQGGVLGKNNVIYGIPFSGTQVLKIDPGTSTGSTFGSIGCGQGNTTRAIAKKSCSDIPGGGWSGGVLSSSQGAIYGIPFSSPNVLKIGGCSTNSMTSTGIIVGSVFGSLALLALIFVSVRHLQRRGLLRCCWATRAKRVQFRGTELMTNGGESSTSSLINPLSDTTQSTLSTASVNSVPFSGYTLSGTTLGGTTLNRTMDLTPEISTTETAVAFSAKTISTACNEFRAANMLGEGAFGVVYRGVLPLGGGSGQHGGREVAIKVLKLDRMARDAKRGTMAKRNAYSGQAQFKREAEVLGKYRHPNIVALLGHCVGDKVERPCLVCEFMPGQSLKKRLRNGPALTWQERHVVASDLARGLVFLHKQATPPVIHQDVKPDNIMLGPSRRGDGLVAKLVDFGIARIAPELAPNKTASHLSTRTRAGTAIYMPYEYHMAGRVSVKTDAYAFGIVLLQVLTGRPPSVRETHEPLVDFIYDKILHPKRHMAELVDKTAGNWDRSKWCALVSVARQCSEHMATERLAVADVLFEVDTLAGRSTGRWGGLGRGGVESSASAAAAAAQTPPAGARTVRAAISRNIYSGAGLVGVRIQVVGRGTGTVVDICHVRGKPTQHVVLFDNGSRELLTLSKDPTNPTKKGHKFYVVS